MEPTLARLAPDKPLHELLIAIILGIYVLVIVYGTKFLYDYLRRRGLPHNVAVYYIRKIIHMTAGGVVALLAPIFFSSPLVPFAMALALGGFLYAARATGRLMYWFQTEENAYEVNFTIAWGVGILLLWLATGDPKVAVLPALFIAFGDAVTGIIRNAVFAKRTKHWYGNLGMALATVPIGYAYAGLLGVVAAVIASVVERYEYPPLDDNVLIVLASTFVLLAGTL